MIKNILILCFLCAILSGIAFSQDEIEINSKVVAINTDKDYLIIGAGENDGVEIGDGLIVHRDGEKLAEAQIVEIRPKAAAAEILSAEKEIKEGDSILIVKKTEEPGAVKTVKKESTPQEPKKSKWKTILGSSADISSAAPVETITASSEAMVETLKPSGILLTQGNSVVRAAINTDLGAVFSYAMMVLRENGYSVIFSNRATGNILATMPIELGIMKELLADATASIEHKLVVSLEMKDNGGITELDAAAFREHTQKGKQIKLLVTRESKYYGFLKELALKIKERAER